MAEPTTTYTFLDLLTDCAEFAGFSRSPGTNPLAAAKRRVNDGYRQFLAAHDWSFLKRTAVLSTESGKWEFDLPDDFSSLAIPFKFPTDDGYTNPTETDEATILELRTGSGSSGGRPSLFAIRPKPFAKEEGTRWEVIFYYTPNGVWEMPFSYYVNVDELVEDTDVPIGGAEHSQTIRDFCLAEVEAFDEEKGGVFTSRLQMSLPNSVRKDNKKRARSVGIMYDPSTTGGVGQSRRDRATYYNDVRVDI